MDPRLQDYPISMTWDRMPAVTSVCTFIALLLSADVDDVHSSTGLDVRLYFHDSLLSPTRLSEVNDVASRTG
ncbi:MAG: hypothetical protein ACJ75H_04325, partial [Thermoanaerobaculia bacterium]